MPIRTPLTHLVVLDFEATCDDVEPPSPQEIIEFPSVLLDASSFEVLGEFESFVRPVHHPKLTAFCKELTGIEQSQVDGAPIFEEVFEAHLAWLRSHGLRTEGELSYALVTCGDWDLRTMLPIQLAACEPPMDRVPAPYQRWINIKEAFHRWSGKRERAGMPRMLSELGLELEGRHHRGIDDSRNIAKIVKALAARDQEISVTTELPPSRYPELPLTLHRDGRAVDVVLRKRALKTLLGLASGTLRKQAKRVFLVDGETELTEADLGALEPGAALRVE